MPATMANSKGAGPVTKLPLEGLRIIDISNVFSLPYAGGLLADLGAEVIKVEGPGRLDVTRRRGVFRRASRQ